MELKEQIRTKVFLRGQWSTLTEVEKRNMLENFAGIISKMR